MWDGLSEPIPGKAWVLEHSWYQLPPQGIEIYYDGELLGALDGWERGTIRQLMGQPMQQSQLNMEL